MPVSTRSPRRHSSTWSCAHTPTVETRRLDLTVLAMFNTLQGRQALFERSHGALRDTCRADVPIPLSRRDLNGDTVLVALSSLIPGPEVFDLRHYGYGSTEHGDLLDRLVRKTPVLPCFRGSYVIRTQNQ